MVEEAMVLYNTIIPIYFEENNFPFIYVNRKINDNVIKNEHELNLAISNLCDQGYSEKLIAKAILSLYPKANYSTKNKGNEIMEASQYCRATSPLGETKSMISSVLLDELYFQRPTDKTLYKINDACNAIVRNLNCKSYFVNEQIEEIAESYKKILTKIRSK
jgi:exoribonuclease R